MTITRTAARLLPAITAATTAAAVASWGAWLRARHCTPFADAWLAGFEAGRAA